MLMLHSVLRNSAGCSSTSLLRATTRLYLPACFTTSSTIKAQAAAAAAVESLLPVKLQNPTRRCLVSFGFMFV